MNRRPLFLAGYGLLRRLADIDFEACVLPYRPDWISTEKIELPGGVELLTPEQAFAQVEGGGASCVIVSDRKYPWSDQQRPWLSRVWRMRRNWKDAWFVASHQIPELARRKGLPIGFISLADHFHIAEHDHALLGMAKKSWVRELPIHPSDLIRNTSLKLRHFASMDTPLAKTLEAVESISLGVSDRLHRQTEQLLAAGGGSVKKEYDIFYSCRDTSPVRARIRKTLQELAARNAYRIFLPDQVLSPDDYVTACLQSHAVISPSGWGWDCWRHYEAAMCASVPIMNYPTIVRYAPLVEDVHAFYFGLEDGGLELTLRRAFANRDRLVETGREARAHVIRHHLNSVVLKKVRDEILA